MIDTGFPGIYKDMQQELLTHHINLKDISKILLTHGDVDHIGNLKKLLENSNAVAYSSQEEIPYLAKRKAYSIRKRFLKIMLKIPKFKNINILQNEYIDDIKIIKTPGHTPGHVCYKYKNYLFVGDLINTRNNQVNLMDLKYTFDSQQSIVSIKNLDLQGIDFICPAHGDVIDVNKFKTFQKNL
jgi:glyoxylase-like metal-dependent hydrolase (beta-lactamase superfamily II)